MASQTFIVGDFGDLLQVPMEIDITGYDHLYIDIQKPDGLEVTKEGYLVQSDPGIIGYVFEENDIILTGIWRAHGRVIRDGTIGYLTRALTGGTVYTTFANTAVFDYFDNASVLNDALYIHNATAKFSGVTFRIGTALAATSITITAEYYNGSTYVALSNVIDATNAFRTTGIKHINWTVPDDWAVNPAIGGSLNTIGYTVRLRISAVSALTEGGANITTAPFGDEEVHTGPYTPFLVASKYSAITDDQQFDV